MDERSTPETLAGWLAQIAEWAPADMTTEVRNAIAESCEAFRDAGALDNWSDVFTTAETILKNARTRERTHGDVNPQRASVDTLQREYDRTPMIVGRSVDPWEGQRHTWTKTRSKKGVTGIRQNMSGKGIIARGVAPVIGSCDAPDPDNVRAAMASHLLSYVRSLRLGLNSLNVAQITDAVYGSELEPVVIGMRDDGTLRMATMLGTDFQVWDEAVPPAHHPALREPIWEHNVPAPRTFARHGVERAPVEERGPVYGPRLPVVTWQAHATCSHTDDTRRASTRRTRLARVKPRKSEASKLEPSRVLCLMRGTDPLTGETFTRDLSITRIPLIAPTDHDHVLMTGATDDWVMESAFFGHRLRLRGVKSRGKGIKRETAHAARDRARSERRAIVARTLPSVTIETRQGWDTLAESLAPGDRFHARVNGTYVLTVTRSPHAGKFNLRLMTDAPVGSTGRVALNLQVRSASTVARRLHAAVI